MLLNQYHIENLSQKNNNQQKVIGIPTDITIEMRNISCLAFYLPYGNEKNGKEYLKEELKNPAIVKQIFDYCQILEGHITYSGWLFLLKVYGYEKLYEIDKKSGWFDSSSLEEFIQDVNLEIRMAKATEYDTCIQPFE